MIKTKKRYNRRNLKRKTYKRSLSRRKNNAIVGGGPFTDILKKKATKELIKFNKQFAPQIVQLFTETAVDYRNKQLQPKFNPEFDLLSKIPKHKLFTDFSNKYPSTINSKYNSKLSTLPDVSKIIKKHTDPDLLILQHSPNEYIETIKTTTIPFLPHDYLERIYINYKNTEITLYEYNKAQSKRIDDITPVERKHSPSIFDEILYLARPIGSGFIGTLFIRSDALAQVIYSGMKGDYSEKYLENILTLLKPIIHAIFQDIAENALSNEPGGEIGYITNALLPGNTFSENDTFMKFANKVNPLIKQTTQLMVQKMRNDRTIEISSIIADKEIKEKSKEIVTAITEVFVTNISETIDLIIHEEDTREKLLEKIESKQEIAKANANFEKLKKDLTKKIHDIAEKIWSLKLNDIYDTIKIINIEILVNILLYEGESGDTASKLKEVIPGERKIKISEFATNWIPPTIDILRRWHREKHIDPSIRTVKFVLENIDITIPTLIDEICNFWNGKGNCDPKKLTKTYVDQTNAYFERELPDIQYIIEAINAGILSIDGGSQSITK